MNRLILLRSKTTVETARESVDQRKVPHEYLTDVLAPLLSTNRFTNCCPRRHFSLVQPGDNGPRCGRVSSTTGRLAASLTSTCPTNWKSKHVLNGKLNLALGPCL